MFQNEFGAVQVLHVTIIAHIPISVYGSGVPIFSTTCAKALSLCQVVLAAIFDNTIITRFFCRVIGIMLSFSFTSFVTLVRGLNQGAVLDTIIINTFISRVISIMFPISSRVFPITQATRIASIYIITFQNGAIYRVVPNFKQIHSLKVGVIQIFSRSLSA